MKRKLYIKEISPEIIKNCIKIKDPNEGFVKNENDFCFIDLQEFGEKNTVEFLKIAKTNIAIFSKRKPSKKILNFFGKNDIIRPKETNPFALVNKATSMVKLSYEKKLELLKNSKLAPRIIINFIHRKNIKVSLDLKLQKIDRISEPTYEMIAIALQEDK